MFSRMFLSVLVFLSGISGMQAAANDHRLFSLKNTHLIQLPSKATQIDYELVITLPSSYLASPTKKYPVLYYVDAYWDAPLVNAIYGGLVYDTLAPEFIMVGISYADPQADYDQERLRDLTPTTVKSRGEASGGAPAFLQFLKETLIPMVEKNYRVEGNERALGGSSLGGLFALYAMYEDPAFFKRYIAISPAVDWDNSYLAKRDAAYAKDNKTLSARVFLSYSMGEYKPFGDPIAEFQQQLKNRNYSGLQLMNYVMQDIRHAGVKPDGYVRGLMWVWKDLAPTGPSGLEKAYKARQ